MSRDGGQDYFLLRAEWLRFRSHLFDSGTELPTLAAAMDDVRRLLEERGVLGLVYLDLGGHGQLEALHGWQAYDEILSSFAEGLRGLCGEVIGLRDIITVLSVRSDKFLLFLEGDVRLGLDAASLSTAAARVRARLSAELSKRLSRPSLTSVYSGHCLIFRDPMLRTERSIHRALDTAVRASLRERNQEEGHSAEGLDGILASQHVVVLYQPILDLTDRSVLGHEVFTRGPVGGPFETSQRLFSTAERTGRLVALERLCRKRALDSLHRHLRPGAKLFLNTSAVALLDPEIAGEGFLGQIEAAGLQSSDAVLEITERVAVEGSEAYREVLRHLKRAGVRIAIDDMGAGYCSLKALVELEPDYLKFDISLVRNIDRSQIKRSLLETLVELSEKIDASIIAEGIELESELTTLREMGVRLGQGRLLAPPVAVPEEAAS